MRARKGRRAAAAELDFKIAPGGLRGALSALAPRRLAAEVRSPEADAFAGAAEPVVRYVRQSGGLSGLAELGAGVAVLLLLGAVILLYQLLQMLRAAVAGGQGVLDGRPALGQLAAPAAPLVVMSPPPAVNVYVAGRDPNERPTAGSPLPLSRIVNRTRILQVGELGLVMDTAQVYRRAVISTTESVVVSGNVADLGLQTPTGRLLARFLPMDLGIVHPTQQLWALNVGVGPAAVTSTEQPVSV